MKLHFHCEARNKPVLTSEKKSEIEFFNTLLNTALMSIKRYEQFHQHAETLGFLYKISKYQRKKSL
jgi:hypothetical protein